MSAQQLSHSNGGGAFYFNLNLNGATVIYAYNTGNQMVDLHLSRLIPMNVGDYISFSIGGSQVAAWGPPHSSVSMFRVR